MKHRIILHIDMDAFFPSIEERENPHFQGKPIIVGADPKEGKGRGVVSSASYEARKYGIKSGMPISKAWKLCPQGIFLPVNMELYQKVSNEIMEIIKQYSPKYEIVSLDEAYLDLTEYSKILLNIKMFSEKTGLEISYKKAEELAKKLKDEIFKKEKLTSSIGIGPNKTIAKLASEKAKPNGLKIVKPEEVENFLAPLAVNELPGIGPKTTEKLKAIGINTISELKSLSKEKLVEMFGKVGEFFWQKARGIDQEPVSQKEIIKSVGRQITFEKDTRDPKLIFEKFDQLIMEVYREIESQNFSFKTITVICRYLDFETHTKSKTLEKPSKDFSILKREAKKLLLKFIMENFKLIRLIGLRVKKD